MDELIHEFATEIADADGHIYTARAMGGRRQRTRKLLRRFGNVVHRQRVDCDSLDVDREELTLASAARYLEEARLFEVPDLAHECAVQRRSAGPAASGESFSSVHDVPIGIASAKRAWPILTVE